MPTKTKEPKRYQCCHILTDGHRCGSPALKQELFCYYHHTTRKPVPPAEVNARKGRRAEFTLPRPEDRSAIQHSIGEVLLRIATHGIDSRRAGLLLYGLQIASLNLLKPNPKAREEETVDEILIHPTHGEIAPVAVLDEAGGRRSFVRSFLDGLGVDLDDDEPEVLTTLQAVGCANLAQPPSLEGTIHPRKAPKR